MMVVKRVVVQVIVMSSFCYASDDITPALDSLISAKPSSTKPSSAVITSQPQQVFESDCQSSVDEFAVHTHIESYDLKVFIKTGKLVRVTRSHRWYEVASPQGITSKKRSIEPLKSNTSADCLDCCISCCSDCCSCLWDCFCGLESDEVRKQYAVVASGRLGYYNVRNIK